MAGTGPSRERFCQTWSRGGGTSQNDVVGGQQLLTSQSHQTRKGSEGKRRLVKKVELVDCTPIKVGFGFYTAKAKPVGMSKVPLSSPHLPVCLSSTLASAVSSR